MVSPTRILLLSAAATLFGCRWETTQNASIQGRLLVAFSEEAVWQLAGSPGEAASRTLAVNSVSEVFVDSGSDVVDWTVQLQELDGTTPERTLTLRVADTYDYYDKEGEWKHDVEWLAWTSAEGTSVEFEAPVTLLPADVLFTCTDCASFYEAEPTEGPVDTKTNGQTFTSTLTAYETCEVAIIGTIDCIRLDLTWDGEGDPPPLVGTLWLSEGIGVVKMQLHDDPEPLFLVDLQRP